MITDTAQNKNSQTDILKSVFGYDSFRTGQEQVITHTLNGGNSLVIMPTGSGKSLCFQIPALCLKAQGKGTAVVISPLIALMQDQVDMLKQSGVRAAALNSQSDNAHVYKHLMAGELDIVYLSPERIMLDGTLNALKQIPLSLIAVDEAHCISQWGHDFRPEYTQLKAIVETLPHVPVMALTATADKTTQQDIKQQLGMENALTFLSGFDRPNIKYIIVPKTNGRHQILDFIATYHKGDCGIIYCNTRNTVEKMVTFLQDNGLNAHAYHAGMTADARNETLHTFQYDDDVVVVATVAFGMGIDKPSVRYVAHLDVPKNIESYYQETGRAGRDGLPATAFMTYSASDIGTQRFRIQDSDASDQQKILENTKLTTLESLCTTTTCRRQILLNYFDDNCTTCGNCDNCLNPPETYDATTDVQKLLSCVYRTGQRFGATYVIDVLRGSENARIKQFGHHTQSTYGIGTDKSAQQWKHILSQCLAHGLIAQSAEKYGGIFITPSGTAFLKQHQTIKLSQPPKAIKGKKSDESGKPTVNAFDLSPQQQELFERLRTLRMKLAKQQNVPAFVIFSDATLIDMVQKSPTTPEHMLAISGVGQKKLNLYGDVFLEVINTPDGG